MDLYTAIDSDAGGAAPAGGNGRRPNVREKVLQYGVAAAEDQELVMLLLGSGTRKHPVSALARRVLSALAGSNSEDRIEALMHIDGMGPSKTLIISAAIELGRRLNSHTFAPIKKPQDLVPYVQHYVMQPKEHFISVTMNGAHEILHIRIVSVGTVNKTLIHPREIFADAIKDRASAIILCHNHPSGACTPSKDDIVTTEQLFEASKVIGIHILDHIILTRKEFFSFREHNMVFE
ncbi:MAG: DNA repair protein RadC [Spirochaetaceae bacterium]|jgi:DNA repair protein RadC|nr:DNA repair protein RadC [Spirochaetaceae bacterium]